MTELWKYVALNDLEVIGGSFHLSKPARHPNSCSACYAEGFELAHYNDPFVVMN